MDPRTILAYLTSALGAVMDRVRGRKPEALAREIAEREKARKARAEERRKGFADPDLIEALGFAAAVAVVFVALLAGFVRTARGETRTATAALAVCTEDLADLERDHAWLIAKVTSSTVAEPPLLELACGAATALGGTALAVCESSEADDVCAYSALGALALGLGCLIASGL